MFLSIVIPAYNEESKIIATLESIIDFLSKKNYSYEIIVVDDGSRDNTYHITKNFAEKNKNVLVLKNQKNEGKGSAIKKGVMSAQGEYILFMDADHSTPINEIDKMLSLLESNKHYGFVFGSRYVNGAKILIKEPFLRILLGKIYHYIVKIFILRGVKDYNCGFKLFRKNTAKNLFSQIFSKDYTFDVELFLLAKQLGYRYKEIPVTWKHNSDSKVKPFIDGVKSLFSLIKIKLNYSKKIL
jgi:dolichyl-phosphate beta-glucosyltransferase